MIKLEFIQMEQWSYSQLLTISNWNSIEGWPAKYLEFKAFFGGQVFVIDDCNFSYDCPILSFAKTLRDLSFGLERVGQQASIFDPTGEKIGFTQFSRDADSVIVEEIAHSSGTAILSAVTTIKELQDASSEYLESVLEQCNSLVPGLRDNPSFCSWLNGL